MRLRPWRDGRGDHPEGQAGGARPAEHAVRLGRRGRTAATWLLSRCSRPDGRAHLLFSVCLQCFVGSWMAQGFPLGFAPMQVVFDGKIGSSVSGFRLEYGVKNHQGTVQGGRLGVPNPWFPTCTCRCGRCPSCQQALILSMQRHFVTVTAVAVNAAQARHSAHQRFERNLNLSSLAGPGGRRGLGTLSVPSQESRLAGCLSRRRVRSAGTMRKCSSISSRWTWGLERHVSLRAWAGQGQPVPTVCGSRMRPIQPRAAASQSSGAASRVGAALRSPASARRGCRSGTGTNAGAGCDSPCMCRASTEHPVHMRRTKPTLSRARSYSATECYTGHRVV